MIYLIIAAIGMVVGLVIGFCLGVIGIQLNVLNHPGEFDERVHELRREVWGEMWVRDGKEEGD